MNSLLPKEKKRAETDLNKFKIFLYGSPKIGKSTFASQFDKPLFLATEAGLTALDAYQIPITSWEEFQEACEALQNEEHDFKTVVIDTVDNLAKFCTDYTNRINGVNHESDLGYGKGYSMAHDRFLKSLTWLSQQNFGLVLVSHENAEIIKTRTSELTKMVPTLPKGYRKIVLGAIDLILYAHMVERKDPETEEVEQIRVLRTKPTENWEAGDRTGRLPEAIRFNFEDFKKAWEESNNG